MTETPDHAADVPFEDEMFTQTVPERQKLVFGGDSGFEWVDCSGSGKPPGDIIVQGERVLATCFGHCGRSIVRDPKDSQWVVEPVAIDPEV